MPAFAKHEELWLLLDTVLAILFPEVLGKVRAGILVEYGLEDGLVELVSNLNDLLIDCFGEFAALACRVELGALLDAQFALPVQLLGVKGDGIVQLEGVKGVGGIEAAEMLAVFGDIGLDQFSLGLYLVLADFQLEQLFQQSILSFADRKAYLLVECLQEAFGLPELIICELIAFKIVSKY